jgi:monoamine oxidase
MLTFLRKYGSLDEAGKYSGSDAAGYAVTPGAGEDAGVLSAPVDMHTLLDADFWDGILFEEAFDMQATMFQPVGGMDRIPYAFKKALGETVMYGAAVTELRKSAKGVRVGYTQAGQQEMIEADYCVCALPLSMMKSMPNDLSAAYKDVIAQCTYSPTYKIAWESRRFWEQDYNIYGGLEFVKQGCSPVWFPSAGLFTDRGVFVSGYEWKSRPEFVSLDMKGKFEASRASVERLHPGHGKELEKPIYIGWGMIPWNEGAWIESYGPEQLAGPAGRGMKGPRAGYEVLLEADGPVYFVGDLVSHIVGWQEGAALSSWRAIGLINERVKASRG